MIQGLAYTMGNTGKEKGKNQQNHKDVVFCLDADTGKVIWDKGLGSEGYEAPNWGYASSPRIHKEMLLLNAGTCGLALNKQDGSIIWTNGKGPGRYASLVLYTSERRDLLSKYRQRRLLQSDGKNERGFYFNVRIRTRSRP